MSKLKIVKGNTFETVIEVRAYKYNGEEITNFDLNKCTNIVITSHVSNDTSRVTDYEILDAKNMSVRWNKPTKLGDYAIEVSGKIGNDNWRFYDKKPIFTIVNTNAEAEVPQQSIIREDCYYVDKQKVYIISPKGDKGDQGPEGPQGPKGNPFTYDDFTPEQLASLKGEKGDEGAPGRNGKTGP